MSNPPFLFCDTDALIQLFVADEIKLLGRLRNEFGISSLVVGEVEREIRFHSKFLTRFEPPFLSAVRSESLHTLDEDSYVALFEPIFPAVLSVNLWEKIQTLGERLNRYVGAGEAFSHAAGQVLSTPVLSNDSSAVTTLLANNLQTASPVLRSFDIICLATRLGWIDQRELKDLLQRLDRDGERRHSHFQGVHWEAMKRAIDEFPCRLDLWTDPGEPPKPNRHSSTLYLHPLQ